MVGFVRLNPLELLTRSARPQQLLEFFKALDEEMLAAAADSARMVPEAIMPSAKQARGSMRRHFMERAVRNACQRAEIDVGTGWTTPPTWSYPTVRCGAFTLTLGVVFSGSSGRPRRLRTRSRYVEVLCRRNAPLNPQGTLFETDISDVPGIIPEGAFGGLIVSEHSAAIPDVPTFVGLWMPSEDLKSTYHGYSIEQVMAFLRDKIAAAQKPVRKDVERKMPKFKRKPSDKI